MATTIGGARMTERHRVRQLAIRRAFLRQFVRMWPLLNADDLDGTTAAWLTIVVDLVARFRTQSAATALTYYDAFRTWEIGEPLPDRALFVNLAEMPTTAIQTSLLVTGPINIKSRIAKGADVSEAAEAALVDASGAAGRHVMNGGRSQITETAAKDKVAVGWARVTDGDPCWWCAMLASRGPTYSNAASAAGATTRAKHREVGERYHDHCGCGVEPSFDRESDWPGRGKEFDQLWRDSTQGGGSAKERLKRFRQAYESQRPRKRSQTPTKRDLIASSNDPREP
jgi:hypothetical protein